MTRSVRGAALLLDVIAATDNQGFSKLPPKRTSYLESLNTVTIDGLRLGWSPDIGYAPVQKQVLDISEKAMSIFADLGCKVEEVKINFEGCEEIFRTIAWEQNFLS
jgi:aspartyl-tRNA(Asn)/glutamyl-tRNA(Gln) amidotransferase subunit A